MPPKGTTPKKEGVYVHQIERTPEYVEFIKKLEKFHEERGTSFEPEPRLATMFGSVQVDLFRLYKTVIEKGGYDELNKVQKAWQVLANELGMHFDDSKGMGQLSFQLKHGFYKYLGAFWIKDQYGKEPPPKEILESLSCATKNGPLLTRTVESFKLASRRPTEEVAPKEDRSSETSTPVSGTRASGRLREAPPQRIPFQPETGPSRQPRQTSSQHSTPVSNSAGAAAHHNSHGPHHGSHGSHGSPANHHQQHLLPHPHHQHHIPPPQHHNGNNHLHMGQPQPPAVTIPSEFIPTNPETASRLTESFEWRKPIEVPIRPVQTPGNNPVEFAKRQRQLRTQVTGAPETQGHSRPVVPGSE